MPNAVLAGVPHLRIWRWRGQRAAMCSRSVLVHRPSRLGAAAPVVAAELQYCDGVLALWARERGHAIDQFDGVMSHSFKSSPLCHYDYETNVTKGWNPRQPMCLGASRFDQAAFILCKAGRVRMR